MPGQFTIPATLIAQGAERHTAGVDPPDRLTSASIQLVDTNGQWDSTAGTITRWGVQSSADGGTAWSWSGEGAVFQDALPFGSRDRAGGMPQLNVSKMDQSGNPIPLAPPGIKLRLGIQVTANITLGAVINTA